MKGFMSFLSGMILGAMVGATVAILLAPTSGDELRSQMQARAERIQSEVQQAAAERRAELERQLAELREPRRANQG